MAKVKTIKQYRTEQDGNTMIEIPVTDEQSQVIIEMNFKQYIDVLSDILVKYASNFKAGQAVGVYLCLHYIDTFKKMENHCLAFGCTHKRKVELI